MDIYKYKKDERVDLWGQVGALFRTMASAMELAPQGFPRGAGGVAKWIKLVTL
jgi:hypothetical protein